MNQYNQQTAGNDKSKRLPLLKPLFKQILSDRDSFSFIPEEFRTDSELLSAIYSFYTENSEDRFCLAETVIEIRKLFSELVDYQQEGIFVSSGLPITDLSNAVTSSWDTISSVWYAEYTASHPIGRRNADKYEENKRKAYKQVKSFSLSEIERLLHTREEYREKSVSEYYSSAVTKSADEVSQKYADAQELLTSEYPFSKKLCNDAEAVEKIKNLLDSIKELEHLIQPLNGTGKEEQRDSGFYGLFDKLFLSLAAVDRLYDQVRNYLTKKPYSQDKIKLNFSDPHLMVGWSDSHTDSSDNGTQYGGYLFRKPNAIGEYDYYLGISKNTKLFRSFISVAEDDQSEYERLDYYQVKSKTIYGPAYKGENEYSADRAALLDTIRSCVFLANNPSVASAMTKYLNKKPNEVTHLGCIRAILSVCPTFTDTLLKFPEFCRQNELVIRNLQDTMRALAGRLQGADLVASKNYSLFSEIMADIEIIQNSKFYTYFHVSEKEMQQALNAGKKTLYLFKISNQDLSYAENHAAGKRQSRGRENLHTMYFKALMSGSQTVLDIGSGEMYFRKASIPEDDRIIHPANVPVQNKNPKNAKQQSVFPYDLIKDRRYTRNQFSLHLSVTINYQAPKNSPSTDMDVRRAVRSAANPHIIGIDRGERNLLYICVIDGSGNIVLQKSLNEIVSDNGHQVDYHDLLDRREKERDLARKSWNTIENIKELKEGYMSQVIHEICELVVKYDAVIALENLNGGFKNSRAKVEKQVYQKFETMLTNKLNYLADKKLDPDTPGGLLNAYQLTNKAGKKHNNEFQDGILFYVPAWLTSKIDLTTGFVNLFQTKYTTISAAREFFGLFDNISYNEAENLFEFAADYTKFPRGSVDYRQKWTICTNGKRIENGGKKNQYATRTVVLTDEFRELFDRYGIEVSRDLQEQIAAQNDSDFYRQLMRLFALTVQMRNSIPNSDVDYLISPVRNSEGRFFDSRTAEGSSLPENADANGAYNIARKCLWAIRVLQETDEAHLDKVKLAITNQEWLKLAQENEHHE